MKSLPSQCLGIEKLTFAWAIKRSSMNLKQSGMVEKFYVPRLAFEDYETVHHYIASSLYCGIIFHNIIFGFLSAFNFTIF